MAVIVPNPCEKCYKFNKLMNSKKLPTDFTKYKWHTLMLFKYIVNKGSSVPELNSKKITPYCDKIIDLLNSPREDFLKAYSECVDIVIQSGDVTKDRLKRNLYTNELRKIAIHIKKQ